MSNKVILSPSTLLRVNSAKNPVDIIRKQVSSFCRRLLSEQDRDPYSPTYGCFDRRYWGWKLVDFPDATLQRNVYPLAWACRSATGENERETYRRAVVAGLLYSAKIQHSDGSFDQAFPNERSFGATAFILGQMIDAYNELHDLVEPDTRTFIERCLYKAADYLCKSNETHGYISNHLAGAALALSLVGRRFGNERYRLRGKSLLVGVLNNQSPEGWYTEYDGADPGYQTLCMYYLARYWEESKDNALLESLTRAAEFVSWFLHPDGSFAGEYGSRRTAIFYPGGFAILGRVVPLAGRILRCAVDSKNEGNTVSLADVDIQNAAPLLMNYIQLLDCGGFDRSSSVPSLPFEISEATKDFPACGLHVRNSGNYYAVVGSANGGTVRVFDKMLCREVCNDTGYMGMLKDGRCVTSQVTDLDREMKLSRDDICLTAQFHRVQPRYPTPGNYLLLRFANLTVMRSKSVCDVLKKLMVRLFLKKGKGAHLSLERRVQFKAERIIVSDRLKLSKGCVLRWLENRQPFVSIHMASSKYFGGFLNERRAVSIDVDKLNSLGEISTEYVIHL